MEETPIAARKTGGGTANIEMTPSYLTSMTAEKKETVHSAPGTDTRKNNYDGISEVLSKKSQTLKRANLTVK